METQHDDEDSKLGALPPIFVSSTQFATDELHDLEDELTNLGAILTYDVHEAPIVLSKVTKKARIKFDLRRQGLWTEEIEPDAETARIETAATIPATRKRKRGVVQRSEDRADTIIIDSSTESEGELPKRKVDPSIEAKTTSVVHASTNGIVKVVNTEWLQQIRMTGRAVPIDKFIIYIGRIVESGNLASQLNSDPQIASSPPPSNVGEFPSPNKPSSGNRILERAKEDQEESPKARPNRDRFGRRRFGLNTPSANPARWEAGHGVNSQYAHLLQSTTTEDQNDGYSSDLPEMPEWVKAGIKYACQRATPKDSPNEAFIDQLKKIKLARLLTNDEIGVRAYSTSIASLAAYPHRISNPREILALPGCDAKIANLYVEYANTGAIQAVLDLEADPDLTVLRTFYNIWGVGATTAREFYYDRGWRDLDDVVEFGWSTLTRVQQIGVKFYDEFQDPIPRSEVRAIGDVIHRHAVRIRDERIQTMLVGGYRRGKEACGDVDIIVTHPDEKTTADLANDIVASLEEEEWITHTLLLALTNTHRGQQPLPYRSGGGGHGFDSLDKALVVWQDPGWETREEDLRRDAKAKNPNIHRRVDIIISPWRTVGCAVVGWSGGTTFERDLRRYAKNVKTWKFDSSGVRDRRNGEVVDLEGYYMWKGKDGVDGRAKTMEEAEKRIFEGLGLEYREPWERCTG